MGRKRGILALTMLVLAVSCGRTGKSGRQVVSDSAAAGQPFPQLVVPKMIEDPTERITYVINHFWDGLSDMSGVSDSLHVAGVLKEDVEKAFGEYSAILHSVADVNALAQSVSKMFDAAEACERKDTSSNVFETITGFAEKYFYDPNSPVRSEECYLAYLQRLVKSDFANPDMKPAYEFDLSMCSLNRIGEKAADIKFEDINGKKYTLYGIRSDYTLLFFANPGCPNCKEITEGLIANSEVSELVNAGKLKIVNIYIDEQIDKWREYVPEYPREWLCGYDYNYIIRNDLTYSVRAIPSLYILDKDKKVILKDATFDDVTAWIDKTYGEIYGE